MERRKVLGYGIAALLLFSIFILASILIQLLGVYSKKEEEISKSPSIYSISNFNCLTNKTTLGFVTLHKQLKEDEFISYRNSEGIIYSTITRVSDEKYECHGFCSCVKDKESRRHVNIISNSLYFLISTVSLSLAINIAKKYFHDQCSFTLSLTDTNCAKESISSNIDFCEVKKEEREFETEIRHYICKGYCLPNTKIRREEGIAVRDDFNCEKLEIKDGIYVRVGGVLPKRANGIAKEQFARQVLVPFCRSSSRSFYVFTYYHPDGASRVKKRPVQLCHGSSIFRGQRENVSCYIKFQDL